MGVTAVHLIFHGRVQGVGFRAWAERKARRRGLTGWVRNRGDRTVEAVFCGEREMVELMEALCRRGPLAARVSYMEKTLWDGEIPVSFRKLPTAH